MAAFDQREEGARYEVSPSGGFWAPGKYFCFHTTFKYAEASVVLDKYTIIDPERTRTVFNWLQYFSADALRSELLDNGFLVEELLSDVAGAPYDPGASEFAVVAAP